MVAFLPFFGLDGAVCASVLGGVLHEDGATEFVCDLPALFWVYGDYFLGHVLDDGLHWLCCQLVVQPIDFLVDQGGLN